MEKVFVVTIQGKSPLLMNCFHEEAAEEATSGIHKRKEKLSREEDARQRLYLDEQGNIYVPDEWVRQAMITAAKRHKIGRSSAASDVAAAIYITPACILLPHPWVVDTRPVVIPATGGRINRHRPKFLSWGITFQIQIDTDIIAEQLAYDILADAGRLVGIGDFRPEKKGQFGRFLISEWREMHEEEASKKRGVLTNGTA